MQGICDFVRDIKLEENLQLKIDDGHSCWVVGDIHGYHKTFSKLIEKLELSTQDIVLCLGDLIDKGPDSFSVLEMVKESKQIFSIRGNHEEMMRLSVSPSHGKMMKSWLKYGGLITLESFSNDKNVQIELARKWIPFIEKMPTEIILDKFRLVHAGYDKEIPLESQKNQQRMWGRTIFDIKKPHDTKRQIIVGHTPVQKLNKLGKDDIWVSELSLTDGRPSVKCIDTGVFLENHHHPRITALNLTNGEVVYQKKLENYFFSSPILIPERN